MFVMWISLSELQRVDIVYFILIYFLPGLEFNITLLVTIISLHAHMI